MTIELLWSTDPQLAVEFRSLAESQVSALLVIYTYIQYFKVAFLLAYYYATLASQ